MGPVPYRMVPASSPPVRVDFAVFISPEYFEGETKVRGPMRAAGGRAGVVRQG